LPKDYVTWNQKKKKLNEHTFDLPITQINNDPLEDRKPVTNIPYSRRLPMSSLLGTGYMVLKIEGM
jgi:hypothetical protein